MHSSVTAHPGETAVNINLTPTAVKGGTEQPARFALTQNYPNPFNPSTVISFGLAAVSHVTLKVYDILGEEVATLVNETKGPGEYSVRFDGSKLPSGVYLYRINAGNFSADKKLVLMK